MLSPCWAVEVADIGTSDDAFDGVLDIVRGAVVCEMQKQERPGEDSEVAINMGACGASRAEAQPCRSALPSQSIR